MRTIGLLDGMSWESSHEYHRLLHENRWDEAADRLVTAGRSVARAGADFLVLATNTMHKVADRIADGIDIPLLHLADTTVPVLPTTRLHAEAAVDYALGRAELPLPPSVDRYRVGS